MSKRRIQSLPPSECYSSYPLVSDGYGLMYASRITGNLNSPSEIVGVYSLPQGSSGSPFRIHSAHEVSQTEAIVILSSRHYGTTLEAESPPEGPGKTPPIFNIWGVKIELVAETSSAICPLDVLWHRRGLDVPIYTAYLETLKSFLLIGGSRYHEVGHVPAPSYEPSPDELAPIPRADEKLDVGASEPPKPPPYSWTQTSDSLTIAIPLPSNTPKSAIKVTFSPETLTVHVDSEIMTSIPIPRYSAKRLWDGISASSSFWTWDREAEHAFGLLTLYLDKQHEGTKWPQVFAPTDNSDDVEVLETLDPSELWHVREALEKYTTALREGEDASGLGLGRGVPSLAEGEVDVEVDETVGRTACLTWVAENGSIPTWFKNSEEIPFQLLSTPIPGIESTSMSLIVKNHLDGTVYTLETQNSAFPVWTHTSTFSALSFVLASKRDTRFTFHTPEAVFAFEGGIRNRGGNVYIYRSAPPSTQWAKQAILKVVDGHGGSLLGVGALQTGESTTPLMICLAEGELVLIKP
ncbi:putative CS domain containing protein [Lyophyllum shimeji]|uniref:NudC domain-containing protein 1 n=1 Tax=Lyophyllum shimeji TaxID=47721 RepID=A0A9P3PMJ9_LYOSH|nr:putative CS domain containing protein [Lyophyllum shimeji]